MTTERRWLALILALNLGLGVVYALTTPVFEASDELWHYPLVRHLAVGNPLPAQTYDPAQAGPWRQEASQPPLYYYLAAALTAWVDTSDFERARWLNPHADIGVIPADGNVNMVIHDPALNPWQGTLMAVRLVRLASVALGAVTAYLTFRIARLAAPERPVIALGAAAANAFLPMFVFISASVNNDNLVAPLSSLTLLLCLQIVKQPRATDTGGRPRWLLLGVVIGLAALSKITAVGLLPLAGLALLLEAWQAGRWRARRPWELMRDWAGRLAYVAIPAALLAGWWYGRNLRLYGDWSGWNAFLAVVGRRAPPASLAQLWDERAGFLFSYWGLFGGLGVPMPAWAYGLLNGIALVAGLGLLVYLGRLLWSEARARQSMLDNLVRHFGLWSCLLWSVAVLIGLLRWASLTWAFQGRLLFSAVSALSTLLVLGLVGNLPRRAAGVLTVGLAGLLFGLALAAPFAWIRPAYERRSAEMPREIRVVGQEFGGLLRLAGFELADATVRPGENFEVTLHWETLEHMDRDWSVFVHLNDPILGAPIAQRDMYLGQGLLATSLLAPGQAIANFYQLHVPVTAVAPAELTLTAGLYDLATGERLLTQAGRDHAELAQISLEANQSAIPNPILVRFEDQLELHGFSLTPRRLEGRRPLQLRLYWRAMQPLAADYTFFAQVLDQDTTRWASQDLALPTSAWPAGALKEVEFQMTLDAATPAGVYPLMVGVYTRTADGGFDRLQTLTPDGRLSDDMLRLSEIRVDDAG
ncbi:MAG: glycosyltransferase family 39 protein [Candidatus Promineifilaceae bacterium]